MADNRTWYERALHRLQATARISAYIGSAALLVAVVVTVADIVTSNLFTYSIRGRVEITQLSVMWAAFLTIPLGFAFGSHISVELVTARLPQGARKALQALFTLIGAVMLLGYLWWGAEQMIESFELRERTANVGISVWLFWVPIVFGSALSFASALAAALCIATGRFTHKPEVEL